MMPHATDKNIDKFLIPLNNAMKEFNIKTPLQVAAFIAQITHESGSLHYVEEIHDGTNYEFRKDLGNLEFEAIQTAHANHTTTGRWYKGRGLIQITGYYNYKKCGQGLNADLVHNPKLLSETNYACRSAAWFWNARNLNNYADVGDFDRTTKIINGGQNGKADRISNYQRCKEVLEC
jgi:putative chitinase